MHAVRICSRAPTERNVTTPVHVESTSHESHVITFLLLDSYGTTCRSIHSLISLLGRNFLEPLTRYLRTHAQAISSVEFSRALAKLKDFERDTIRGFSGVDAVLTPGLAFAPPPIGFFSEDPESNFRQQVEFTPWTSFVNVAGLPAVVLPTPLESDGIARGVQLIGRPGADSAIITLATRLEELFGEGLVSA